MPLPAASTCAGQVYLNNSGSEILVSGGLGRRGSHLEPGGFAGGDGRVWYRLTRDGVTNSFFPTDFERELFMLPINEQMLRAGMAFSLDFKLALQLFNATSRGEDGHNGMKSQLKGLCARFDQFEKKAIRLIAIGTALPGIVVGVLGILRFLGRL